MEVHKWSILYTNYIFLFRQSYSEHWGVGLCCGKLFDQQEQTCSQLILLHWLTTTKRCFDLRPLFLWRVLALRVTRVHGQWVTFGFAFVSFFYPTITMGLSVHRRCWCSAVSSGFPGEWMNPWFQWEPTRQHSGSRSKAVYLNGYAQTTNPHTTQPPSQLFLTLNPWWQREIH